ncbi:MAG: hypothetical protein MJA29_00260, partial [Candidatus Omnitrophica bacterium]|nr:hypothetical protein [Candidatus Omnitrophota bacterium]
GTMTPVTDHGRIRLCDCVHGPCLAQPARWRSVHWDHQPGRVRLCHGVRRDDLAQIATSRTADGDHDPGDRPWSHTAL